MKNSEKKAIIPDLKEFVDENGKKWVQTSTDDLFSIKELNEMISSIEKERARDEVVFARIDFQKVDKEFYDTAIDLQKKLQKQGKLLQNYVAETTRIINRKNSKLTELVEYIKQLHQFIVLINSDPEEAKKLDLSFLTKSRSESKPDIISEYEEVEEIAMSEEDGN
jgi:ribosomal protein S18